jgi:hypothetical protein
VCRFCLLKAEENRPSKGLGVEGSLKLMWINKKCQWDSGENDIGSKSSSLAWCSDHGIECLASIRVKFIDLLGDYQLVSPIGLNFCNSTCSINMFVSHICKVNVGILCTVEIPECRHTVYCGNTWRSLLRRLKCWLLMSNPMSIFQVYFSDALKTFQKCLFLTCKF